jgi:hypothetical protein
LSPGAPQGLRGSVAGRTATRRADHSSFFGLQFASFEKFVEMIYARLPKPKSECNKVEQLGVSAAAGYAAGGEFALSQASWQMNSADGGTCWMCNSLLRHCVAPCRYASTDSLRARNSL